MSLSESFSAFKLPFAAGILLYGLGVLIRPIAWLFGVAALVLWLRAGAKAASTYRWNWLATAKHAFTPALIVGLIAGGMEFTQFLLGFGTTMAGDSVAGASGTLSNATVELAQTAAQSVPAGSAESFVLGTMAFGATLLAVTFWAMLAASLGAKTSKGY